MNMARFMRQFANHDKVQVGAVAYASSALGFIGLFPAANQNLGKGPNDTKACAEEIALQKVLGYGFDKVHGLFTSGTVQPDSVSGLVTPTLHTCDVERRLLLDLWERGITDAHTPVVTVNPDEDIWEIYPAFPFIDMHHRRASDELRSYPDPGFKQWQVGEVHYLRETARQLMMGQTPDANRIAYEAVIGHYAVLSPPIMAEHLP